MKATLILPLVLFFSVQLTAQSLLGSWQNTTTNNEGKEITTIAVFTENFHVFTSYYSYSGDFIGTNGGSWNMKKEQLVTVTEFNSTNPELVGKTNKKDIKITKNKLVFDAQEFQRIDNGTPGKLQGAWLMSGRKRNGQIQNRDTSRPRKTMKILSGTRFQWIAYNTETKQFIGTGGGTYTTINGKYTENIEFFSRDNSRVGMSLQFNFELIDSNWHHSGKSSKGNPIYEIWSLRK